MRVVVAAAEIDSFRALVARRLGLFFDDTKLDFLTEVLQERMERTGCDLFSVYERRVASAVDHLEEIRALAEKLTVGETYFFRYAEHFNAFAEVVVPNRMQARGHDRKFRILSAGCASGEEAYSLAILIRDQFPEFASWDVSIHGIDINAAVVEKALRARYSTWSLRETPAGICKKYFQAHGRDLRLNEEIRSGVTFEQKNLAEEDALFWQPKSFDVVFCRNVTMYFTLEVTQRVIQRIARSLVPGGFLFLGHAETLRGVSQEFHLRHTHETFYYQRREASDTDQTSVFPLAPAGNGFSRSLAPIVADSSDSWFDTIRGASERIANLTDPKNGPALGGSSGTNPDRPNSVAGALPSVWDRTIAIELLRKERFAEATELLRGLPAASKTDPDTQLLLAVLLTNSGELPEAEKVCMQVLKIDELNSGAHYLIALCREHDSDREAAVRHGEAATYLDSAFAMPHLHLGLLAKRSADMEKAKKELGQALLLLDREDASRILLFGGGFTREALIQFCRAELRTCGGGA